MVPMFLAFWIFVVGQSSPAPLQKPDSTVEDVYARVPEGERQEFRAAVESLLALEKSGNWGKVYDRFYLNDKGLTKKQFIDKRGRLQVVVFVPAKIYYVPPSQAWFVSGCAEFSPPPHLLAKRSGGVISDFAARHTASGWRFDAPPAITIYEDSPSGARPCTVGLTK
jgi:hypothetical protein